MIIISAQAFPPRSGGIQTLMAGLADAAAKHEDVLVFVDKKNEASHDFDAKQIYDVKRFDGFKPLRQRKKAKAVKEQIGTQTVHIIAVSSQTGERLRPFLPTQNSPHIHVMPNPVDAPRPPSKEVREDIEKLWQPSPAMETTSPAYVAWSNKTILTTISIS